MEQKKCKKTYLIKMLLSLSVIIGGMTILTNLIYIESKQEMMHSELKGSTSPPIILVNVKWKDSLYSVVLEDYVLHSILKKDGNKKVNDKASSDKITDNLSYRDTLNVDSLSFKKLKRYMIIPEIRIDTIYNKMGIDGLLFSYFDDEYFIPYCSEDSTLSLSEQRYVIYILLQHDFFAYIDCESGCLIIKKPQIR